MADIVKAREIRTDTGLGKHDLATQSIGDKIYKLWGAFIQDNKLKIATCLQVDGLPTRWVEQDFPDYNAKTCAIEFNGLWSRQVGGDRFYRLNTEYTPWVFWITLDNRLVARKYDDLASLIILDEEVTQVCAVRGFGSPVEYELDQGLILAYVKENGIAYYKNLCRQADGKFAWQQGGHLPLPSPVDTLGVFRGNDYRMGFTGTSNGTVYLMMTDRTWLGMATGIEHIQTGILDITMEVLPVAYIELADGWAGAERIATGIADIKISLVHATVITPIEAHNEDEYIIVLNMSHPITEDYTLAKSAFTIRDSNNTIYPILSIAEGIDKSELIFTLDNFAAAVGTMYIQYDSTVVRLTGFIDGMLAEVNSFDFGFAPNLVPPEGYAVEVISPVFLPVFTVSAVTWHNSHMGKGEKVSFDITNISIVVTKVGSNPL